MGAISSQINGDSTFENTKSQSHGERWMALEGQYLERVTRYAVIMRR